MGFIITFSCMYIIYFGHIQPSSLCLFLLVLLVLYFFNLFPFYVHTFMTQSISSELPVSICVTGYFRSIIGTSPSGYTTEESISVQE